MTDPNEFVAGQIGQQAEGVRAAEPGQGITPPPAGLGVTSVDVDALAAQIAALQARLDEADRASAKAAGHPLADTVKTVQYFLAGHGDQKAIELGNDLAAAVDEAEDSGDTLQVAKIADRLDRYLGMNAPYPGENYFHNGARAFVADLPDLIDRFHPVPGEPQSTDLVKVVAGSVVG